MALPYSARIHPLIAAAAVSTTLVSVMGIAALSGVLPWMPVSPSRTIEAPLAHATAAKALSAVVVPTASVKTAAVLPAAESLAPGETLIVTERLAPVSRIVETAAAPHAIYAMREPQLQKPEPASRQPVRERLHNRETPIMASSGNSTGGSTGAGAGTSAGTGATQPRRVDMTDTRAANDPQRYSDVRRTTRSVSNATQSATPSATPKITPIYRADASTGTVPPANYQDQQQTQPMQRGTNRTTGDVALVTDRNRVEYNRRNAGSDREAVSSAYPVGTGYSNDAANSNTVGTAIGRTVSKGIDKSISVISDVLNGRYVPPPPTDPQDSIYR